MSWNRNKTAVVVAGAAASAILGVCVNAQSTTALSPVSHVSVAEHVGTQSQFMIPRGAHSILSPPSHGASTIRPQHRVRGGVLPKSMRRPSTIREWRKRNGGPVPPEAGSLAGTTEGLIYDRLRSGGFSGIQAAGIMGNMLHESAFNIETDAPDSNGYNSYGLISWNAASYPGASGFVTGNVSRDLGVQVHALQHETINADLGARGSSAAEVGGNWAQYVEVCAGCEPGGHQWYLRSAAAASIYWAVTHGR